MAALRCFNELGYTETPVSLIRKKSGASTGSIYHHFKNKERLAATLYIEGILDYQKGYLKHLSACQNAKAGIFAIVRYHLSWVTENPEWAIYLNRMRHAEFMAASGEQLNKANADFIHEIGAWFRGHIKAGKIRKLPVEIYAALLMGPLQEYTRTWLRGDSALNHGDAAAYLAEAAWSSLKQS